MKILLTSGPCRERIDSVRAITNLSSGRTGAGLTDFFLNKGHDVTLVKGTGSISPQGKTRQIAFQDFQSLQLILRNILQEESFDAIIHLAAVSDYSVSHLKVGERELKDISKLESNLETLTLTLRKNPKLLEQLKGWTERETKVIGFKLTDSKNKDDWNRAVTNLFSKGGVDLIVHNDLSEISPEKHTYRIFNRDLSFVTCESLFLLAQKLEGFLGGRS